MGGNSSKPQQREVEDLRKRVGELEHRVSSLACLAVPQWRLGDRKYYDIHESAWERVIAESAAQANPTGQQQDAAHPSVARLHVGGTAGVLSFDNSAPYGDDLVLSALLLLRKTERVHTLTMVNSGLTDAGADLLATAIRAHPAVQVRCSATTIVLAGNPGITAFGGRQLAAAMLSRPAPALTNSVLDLRGCTGMYTGAKDDVAAFEVACDALQKAAPALQLLLPPRPEVPFVVEGNEVRLSAFQGDRGEYRPLQVGASTWLHREDIKLKTPEKAESLLAFLQALNAQQTRILGPAGNGPILRPYECGSCFMAPVVYVELRAATQVVAVIKAPQGKTYAQLMHDAEESGVPVPRSILLQIFMQVCAAVAYSHSHNFAMRTLRPDLLLVTLERGSARCHYLDYCALRPESMRSTKVQLGFRMAFSDPSVRAGAAISRSMDSYAAAMMVVYGYSFTDVLDDFKQRQYVWLKEAQRPVEDQVPDALAHYEGRVRIDPDVAALVVAMTRPDEKRMSCADAAKALFELATAAAAAADSPK